MKYHIQNDGDRIEKICWNKFLIKHFPNYNEFWARKIVPLTNRPDNINFRTREQIKNLGFNDEDICIAQLHYSILRHLDRAFDLYFDLKTLNHNDNSIYEFQECLFHICSAQDLAFEFLERNNKRGIYHPWARTKRDIENDCLGSEEAKKVWQKNNIHGLDEIRFYRNRVTHGNLLPSINGTNYFLLPKIGLENKYLDWRNITYGLTKTEFEEYVLLDWILEEALFKTFNFLNIEWEKLLR